MGLAMCILHPLRQARTEAFKQIKDRLFSPSSLSAQAPDGGVAIHILQALESHLAATPEGKYPYNRVGEAVLSIARWTFAELKRRSMRRLNQLRCCVTRSSALGLSSLCQWLVSKKGTCTYKCYSSHSTRVHGAFQRQRVYHFTYRAKAISEDYHWFCDACSAMRWRASAQARFGLWDRSLICRSWTLPDTIEDCALQKVSMAHWDLLYDLSAKVSCLLRGIRVETLP